MKDDPHVVGYGRPPRRTRFKKGISGNPAGRPPRQKSELLMDLEKELCTRVQITEKGRRTSITKGRLLVRTLVASAIKGDAKARRDLLELSNTIGGQEPPTQGDDNADGGAAEDAAILEALMRRKARGGHDG